MHLGQAAGSATTPLPAVCLGISTGQFRETCRFPLQLGHFRQSPTVAFRAAEVRREKGLYQLPCDRVADDETAEANQVKVIIFGHAVAWELVQTFLRARFSGATRHRRRLAKVSALESSAAEDVS